MKNNLKEINKLLIENIKKKTEEALKDLGYTN